MKDMQDKRKESEAQFIDFLDNATRAFKSPREKQLAREGFRAGFEEALRLVRKEARASL